MKGLTLTILAIGLTGCSMDLQIRIADHPPVPNQVPIVLCPEYNPPEYEEPPRPIDTDFLPYDNPESVAIALGVELKQLRDYILRRDQRDREKYQAYLDACHKSGKTLQPVPK